MFLSNTITIEIEDEENEKNAKQKKYEIKFNTIHKFYLLKNYYGQIKNIEIWYHINNSDNIYN